MDSFDLSLRGLFDENKYIFQIPNYQRSYVWEREEIAHYLKDITYCYEQNSAGEGYDHFFGQMIFRMVEKDKWDREILEIVDGQQRLTTATITIAALYRLILLNETVIDDRIKKMLQDMKKKYILSIPDRGLQRRKLTLSERDNKVLMEIVTIKEEKILREIEYECTYESENRILKAYNQIFNYFEKYFKSQSVSDYATAMVSFAEAVFSNISVVMIKPKTIGYSYALYQIVNDRGVLLTSAELLKARTMELLHNNDILFSECEYAWDDILNDSGNETTKYLSWHYTSMMHQSTSKTKLHEMYEKKLFQCYGKHHLSKEEQEELANQIRSLHQSVKWCRKLSIGKLPIESVHPQISDMYYALVIGLKNEIAIPLYINTLSINNDKTKEKLIPFLTVLLSRFFYSTRTIAATHNGSITKVYNQLSSLIKAVPIDYENMNRICQEKQREKAVNSIFASKIEDTVYSENSTNISKYLLYLLELFQGCEVISYKHIIARDLSTTITFDNISTEHIAAHSGTDGNLLSENQRDCLGNLTLLGKNKNNELDDKPYSEKRDVYKDSSYSMTREVAENENWGVEEFKTRQEEMKNRAIDIFKI